MLGRRTRENALDDARAPATESVGLVAIAPSKPGV
jgi:hypothetical protein